MLVDLKSLDVVVCQGNTDGGYDYQYSDTGLCRQRAAKRSPSYHDCTDVAYDDKTDYKIAVDAVEHEESVAYDGNELPDHEKTGREDGSEMDGDADTIDALAVPVPLAGCGTLSITSAGRAGDIQIGKTGEGEARDSSGEDDD